ncbi:hypothetical protein ACFQX8_27750 [Klenkia terrae]|uniref:hypothetical protein n=1 Tax=Klenkia terrae TaxID=1052259 RepID=UPI00360837F6
MTRASRARRLATGAVYGGGGVGLAGAGLVALLRQEARLARNRVSSRAAKGDPPTGEGRYGHYRGAPLVLAVLGDSSAVGLGVDRAEQTPASWSPRRSPSWPSARCGWSRWPCPVPGRPTWPSRWPRCCRSGPTSR